MALHNITGYMLIESPDSETDERVLITLEPTLREAIFMALAGRLVSELQQIVGPANVLTSAEDLVTYSFDGTAALQQLPGCVAFVRSALEVASILRLAQREKLPVVTRGSG